MENRRQDQRGGLQNSSREAEIRSEMCNFVENMQETRTRRVEPPVFRDLNPVSQLLPQVFDDYSETGLSMSPFEARTSIALPDHFYRFNSNETTTLLSVLLDSNDARMLRLFNKVHIRAMFREDRYYQLVDDPSLYFQSKCTDMPAFHNRVVLYVTTPGVLVYLKLTHTLKLLSRLCSKGVLPRTKKMVERRNNRQSKRPQPQSDYQSVKDYEKAKANRFTPFFNVFAYQYATYVHCNDGDILRFQLEYLVVKRDYQEALPILMEMGWNPNNINLLLYRRQYYQYVTPFLDWVDLLRYQLKIRPNLSVTGFYEKLLEANSEYVSLDDLRCFGQTMLEYVELRRLTKCNCTIRSLRGLYGGRRVYKDSEPRLHPLFKNAFGYSDVVRPVLHNACSPLRRFLAHLNYYDRQNMLSLPQMLSLITSMLRQGFFAMHPICRASAIRLEPLVFQIYDFVWSIRQGMVDQKVYLRHEPWESIQEKEDSFALYQRWDVLNCICLMFSVCQKAVLQSVDPAQVERLVCLIIDVLRSSEYLEVIMSYSYFDTYMALSSTVNCVPNLLPSCLNRVFQAVPFHLVESLTLSQVLGTFSTRFWSSRDSEVGDARSGYGGIGGGGGGGGHVTGELPRTMREVSEFLMTRSRRSSIKQAPSSDVADNASVMSSMGAAGAVVLFCRDYDAMALVTLEDELVVNDDRIDAPRREAADQKHSAEYREYEIDYRYGTVFTDSYYLATGRPRVFYNEQLTYQQCRSISMAPFRADL